MKKIRNLGLLFGLVINIGCSSYMYSNFRQSYGVILDNSTIMTEDGNLWDYDSELPKDTKVFVTFNTYGTSEIYDDEIFIVRRK